MFGFGARVALAEERIKTVFLEQQLAETRAREDYWRTRCELFIDRAAAKAGLTHEPVMTERSVDQLAGLIPALAGAGMTEFDSTK